MQSNQIQSIRQVLASGQTEMALEQLTQLAQNTGTATQESAILLRAVWEHQEQQAINGLLSFDEAALWRNRINKGVLDLLADIESDGQVSTAVASALKGDLYNDQTAAMMQHFDNDTVSVRHTSIQADDDSSIIIGEGNVLHKKTYNALGIRQFVIILGALILLGGGGYFVYQQLNNG